MDCRALPLLSAEPEAASASPDAAPAVTCAPGEPVPRGPLYRRYVEEANPCPPPAPSEIEGEQRNRAGSVARFYTRGSRVEESESCRSELSQLPLGRRWPWYEERIRELGFTFRDATWSASDRARFGLERNGLCFRLEIVCDSGGRIASLLTDPHL